MNNGTSTGYFSLEREQDKASLYISIFVYLNLREDSQIDFSTHNVKWTLSPDPPAPLCIKSKDKNRFFKKFARTLGPNNPRKT